MMNCVTLTDNDVELPWNYDRTTMDILVHGRDRGSRRTPELLGYSPYSGNDNKILSPFP